MLECINDQTLGMPPDYVLTMRHILLVFLFLACIFLATGTSAHKQKHKGCTLKCPSGQLLDKNRCLCLTSVLSLVKSPPCPPFACPRNCPSGVILTNYPNGCSSCSCRSQNVCPPVLCRMHCPNGWAKDANGCDTCSCKPPVQQKRCPPVCRNACFFGRVVGSDGCPTCTCKTNHFTTPAKGNCGAVCMIYCVYGNALDSRGCPTCTCNPPPSAIGS